MVRWNLKDIYPSLKKEDIGREKELLEDHAKYVESFRERLDTISDKDFLDIIGRLEDMTAILSRLQGYIELSLSENTSSPENNALKSVIDNLSTSISNRLIFFHNWWKHLDDKRAEELISLKEEYSYLLRQMRKYKPYTLKEDEEKIISIKDISGVDALTKIYDIITDAFQFEIEIGGKVRKMTQSELTVYARDYDRKVRRKAYTALLGKYRENSISLGEIYRNIVLDWDNENILIRKYAAPISVRNIGNDISDKAIDALLRVCRKNTGLFKEYFILKNKICGIDDPSRFDLYAPFKEDKELFDYRSSRDIVLKVLGDFSLKMKDAALKVFNNDHIHSDIIQNKRSGAFCYSITPRILPYVMLNHADTVNDLHTMAHELGHAVHSILADKNNIFTFHSALPLAETASIFSELLLTEYLLKDIKDKEERLTLLLKDIDGIYASVMRQAFFIIFEKRAHKAIMEGAAIDELDSIYLETLKEQFEGALEIPEIFKHEWKYIPHIYHTPFYCYAYAFGNLLVLALYSLYKEEGESFIPRYIKLLSYGGSRSPADILGEIGIDIESEDFWQKGFDLIKSKIEEIRKLSVQ